MIAFFLISTIESVGENSKENDDAEEEEEEVIHSGIQTETFIIIFIFMFY